MALRVGISRENADFKFLELRKVRVANTVAPDVRNGIVVSEPFKLVFAITNESRVDVLTEDDIFNFDWSKSIINQTVDASPLTAFNTHFRASFLSISITGRVLLASGITTAGSSEIAFYDVQQIAQTRTATAFANISFPSKGNQPKKVISADWHPEFAESLLIVCFSDGSVSTIAVNADSKSSAKLTDYFVDPGITSVSWSPKGKQVLMAKANGCITFYKHNNGTGFSEARNIAPPDELKSFSVSNVKWIMSTIIMASYIDPRNPQDADTRYLLVTAPTKAMPEYYDYGRIVMDIAEYADAGRSYASSFHLIGNMILAATSHSSEISVIGCENVTEASNAASWDQYVLDDNARIEAPMNGSNDTFCRGLSFTMSSPKPIRVGENEVCGGPGTPCLYLLTSAGVICPYYVVHRKNLVQPLGPALNVQQLQFTGVQNTVPVPQPSAVGERHQSPNNLSFCPPSHSTPTANKPANKVFGLKPATFGSGQPLSQPMTETPLSAMGRISNPSAKPVVPEASALTTAPGSNVFGSSASSLLRPAKPSATSSFSFGAAADVLNSEAGREQEKRKSEFAKAEACTKEGTKSASAPDPDIPLEEALKEIACMQKHVSDHKEQVRQFLTRRIADEAYSHQFTGEHSRLEHDFKGIHEVLDDSRIEIKALKGWIGQDYESLAAAERRLNKLRDENYSKSIFSFKLDPLTSKQLAEVRQRAETIETQLRLTSETLHADWNSFIASANGGLKADHLTEVLNNTISECGQALSELDKSVRSIENKVGIE